MSSTVISPQGNPAGRPPVLLYRPGDLDSPRHRRRLVTTLGWARQRARRQGRLQAFDQALEVLRAAILEHPGRAILVLGTGSPVARPVDVVPTRHGCLDVGDAVPAWLFDAPRANDVATTCAVGA